MNANVSTSTIRQKITYACVQRIASNVYNTLDVGHVENIYQKAIILDVVKAGHKCECEKIMPVIYDEQQIGVVRADLFIDDDLVVELKAVATVQPAHFQQVRRYGNLLNTTNMMLINFPTTGMLEVHAFIGGTFQKMQTSKDE